MSSTPSAGAAVVVEAGAAVTSIARCNGGEIVIEAGLTAIINGLVISEGTTTRGRGGPITITSTCTVSVGDRGQVISRGRDPGADRVHIEAGCDVLIQGLVASTGPGHTPGVPNRCFQPDRLDKPANAHAAWRSGRAAA